jgi:hypothetical protein
MQHFENICTPAVCQEIRKLSVAAYSAVLDGLCLLSLYLKFAMYVVESILLQTCNAF